MLTAERDRCVRKSVGGIHLGAVVDPDPTLERSIYRLPYGGPNLCGICYSDHRICHCLQGKEYLMIRAYCGRGHFGQLFVDEDGEITCLTCGWRPEPSPPPDKLENSRVRATNDSR